MDHAHQLSVALAAQNAQGDNVGITFDALDAQAIAASVLRASCGGTALFIGTTRDTFQGKRVVELRYQSYSSLALKSFLSIIDAVRRDAGEGELHCAIHHRLGVVPVKEASIVIAVSSPHRRAAFEACERILEEVKARAPIWKQEVYAAGEGDAEWKANIVPPK